ncbi:MAG: hypothetical protein HQM15_02500 [Deltaproteobacteria bacterium]|nr:hypothetical protein [Deltaproteobacteria bacterium]
MQRWLEKAIQKDLKEKIVLLAGPRQVGKTTVSRSLFSKKFETSNRLNY